MDSDPKESPITGNLHYPDFELITSLREERKKAIDALEEMTRIVCRRVEQINQQLAPLSPYSQAYYNQYFRNGITTSEQYNLLIADLMKYEPTGDEALLCRDVSDKEDQIHILKDLRDSKAELMLVCCITELFRFISNVRYLFGRANTKLPAWFEKKYGKVYTDVLPLVD